MPTSTRLTIEDFERLPAEQAWNHELINREGVDVSGEHLRSELASGLHRSIIAAVNRKKDRYKRCGMREMWIISQESWEVYVYSDQRNRILHRTR